MITVEQVSSAVLPAGFPAVRAMPRPSELRQEGYEKQYDSMTVFCDAFYSDGRIVLSGPPLFNLRAAIDSGSFRLDRLLPMRPRLSDLWKTQRSFVDWGTYSLPRKVLRKAVLALAGCRVLSFDVASEGRTASFRMPLQPDGAARFSGRRVLFTLQKGNRLEWVRDWAEYYHRIHGVDAVVIYDNGSPDYRPEDLAKVLSEVDGIEEGCVLSWPFPYGPGSPRDDTWDSDFCQYTALEHMRWRFCRDAEGIINADIDELVVCDDGRSVFDHLKDSESGFVAYQCNWVEAVATREIGAERHFWDFVYRSKKRMLGTKKWTVDPRRMPDDSQFCVHRVKDGPVLEVDESIRHRHFFAINTDWKRERSAVRPVDPEIHYVDEPLVAALAEAFGENRLPEDVRAAS